VIDWKSETYGDDGEIQVLRLIGRIDASSCDYLFSVLEGRIEDGQKKLILDCGQVEFISSVGLGMLIRAHSRMKKHEGDVRLSGLQGGVADVVHLTGLDQVFKLYPSVDEAVRSFG
jgi:anti-sigma B factor antagonist